MSAGRAERSRRYASLKEVAARAGVSFQTASKVLNGGSVRVAAQTQERILAAARELGYSPNTIARSLVRRSTCTLGLIASDMADGALARFAVAAEREARRHGHAVLVGNLGPGGEDGADVVRMLIERRVDGLIAAAPQLEDDLTVSGMLRSRIPTVSLHHVPGGGVPVVGSNHRDTGRLAVGHLVGLGHRRIGTVAGPLRRRVVRSRLRGYEDTLREAGLEPAEDLVVEADWTAGGAAAATRLLLERERTLTAVFVHSDTMAIGVLSALAAAGRQVPGDVAVVGCDDMPFAEYLTPALTSVRVPFEETGQQAVRLLLARIAQTDRSGDDDRERGRDGGRGGDGVGGGARVGDGDDDRAGDRAGEPEQRRGRESGDEHEQGNDPVLLPVELIVRDSCGGSHGETSAGKAAPTGT